ncbi:unnamed protein product [Periconia digitata]|uniref:Uncharacterized protein n=1 Tax=Periconia digitata TaxID=1303443 RepID=A0A9W4USI5_9PLEO|nr:unnamed protein product [Periconia digitata]
MANFMSLPAEIRYEIYDQAMFPHHDYVAIYHCTAPKDVVSTVLKSPIFRLSACIRKEAMIRLFKTKLFEFSDFATALHFLGWAGKYGEELITKVKLLGIGEGTSIDQAVATPLGERLVAMKALKSITIMKLIEAPRYAECADVDLSEKMPFLKELEKENVEVKILRVGGLSQSLAMHGTPNPM